jgi:hypothetical protein
MPNLTRLGSRLFLGSVYSVVVHADDNGQVWVAHHTDKTRNYKTDWSAEQVAQAISDGKTIDDRIRQARAEGVTSEKHRQRIEHNKLPWWKRMRKKE